MSDFSLLLSAQLCPVAFAGHLAQPNARHVTEKQFAGRHYPLSYSSDLSLT